MSISFTDLSGAVNASGEVSVTWDLSGSDLSDLSGWYIRVERRTDYNTPNMRFFYNDVEMEYEDDAEGALEDTVTNRVSLSGESEHLEMRWSNGTYDNYENYDLYVYLVEEVDGDEVERGRIVVSAEDDDGVFSLGTLAWQVPTDGEDEDDGGGDPVGGDPDDEEVLDGAECFLGDTKVKTDQGPVAFNKLTTNHSIGGKRIKKVIKVRNSDDSMIFIRKHSLGKGIPNKNTYISRNHGIYLPDGSFIRARNLITNKGIAEHSRNHDLIYNVLLDIHGKMNVNGMICETLNMNDPSVRRLL